MSEDRKTRNYPRYSLEEALVVPQKIQDESGGRPFKRLLLADAVGIKPASSNYKYLLSSSRHYGLTEGTEKAAEIKLTDLGRRATGLSAPERLAARREAALQPELFGRFFRNYRDKKVPSNEMLAKILVADYGVGEKYASEAALMLLTNGRLVDIIRDIGGSPHVLLDAEVTKGAADEATIGSDTGADDEEPLEPRADTPAARDPEVEKTEARPRPLFVGHGKNRKPLESLQRILTSFQIPFKVAVDEAHLGRPIPQKVREVMEECGSAILVFTKDEEFKNDKGEQVWRPSENVVYELGAASFAYGDRIVIFKERGIHFPTNFESVGYIEFDTESLEAKTTELLKELIGFGLIKITPA